MKKLVSGLFAMVAVGSLSVGCAVEPGDEGVEQEDAVSTQDPLGVDLESVGFVADEQPCGDDAHVASVMDGEGRYLAFCVSAARDTFVVQSTPSGVAPIGEPGACALDTFLKATPDDAAVPQALVEACQRTSIGGRPVSAAPVRVGDPAPMALELSGGPSAECSNATYFSNTHCAAINTYTSHYMVSDSVSWCALGPYTGTSTRTASAQGLPTAYQGRTIVAGCGSASTTLQNFVLNDGVWELARSVTALANGTVKTLDVYLFDGDGDVTDLRMKIVPAAGASYRYTGAYIELYPVP